MIPSRFNAPEGVPSGYSWIDFAAYSNRTLNELLDYKKRSEMDMSTDEILYNIREFVKYFKEHHVYLQEAEVDNPKKTQDSATIWCCEYILDHPEIHHMLKSVRDGSYRTNRLLLKCDYCIFTNYNHQRFLESIYLHTDAKKNNVEIKNRDDAIALLREIIDKDGIIFVQFDELLKL